MKILILISSLLVSMIIACHKDDCDGRTDFSLNDYAVAAVPYQPSHIVEMITSDSVPVMLVTTRTEEVFRPDAPLICDGYLEVRLRDNNANKLFAEILMRGSTVTNGIQIIVFHDRISGPIINLLVDENNVITHSALDAASVFFPQLTIDGVDYSNVVKITFPDLHEPEGIKEFYYNAEFGILKIVTNENFTISLVQ